MAQELNQEEVLIARNNDTGQVGAVTGLNEDGTPKMTDVKSAKLSDLVKFWRDLFLASQMHLYQQVATTLKYCATNLHPNFTNFMSPLVTWILLVRLCTQR